MHAKLGMGFGTHPGYWRTCITGVTWHSSVDTAASAFSSFVVNLGSMHIFPRITSIIVVFHISLETEIRIGHLMFSFQKFHFENSHVVFYIYTCIGRTFTKQNELKNVYPICKAVKPSHINFMHWTDQDCRHVFAIFPFYNNFYL